MGIPKNTIQNTPKSKGPRSAYRATLCGRSHYRITCEVAIGNSENRISGNPILRVPELKYRKYDMIRTLPGGISGAEALTSTYSFVANETTRMLHILHILAFPEPRFVNLGFSEIRTSGHPDIGISVYLIFRISRIPEVRRLLRASFPALIAYCHMLLEKIWLHYSIDCLGN